MPTILTKLKDVEDLKQLSSSEIKILAQEIRAEIIKETANNGGHLASNLGVVELTLAIGKQFDFDHDRIIFDVGHQCYTWKLITQRYQQFSQLRKKDGLSGFPKTSESPYDYFNTGHSSTSISAALGMSRGKKILGEKGQVYAFIGDGALTGGMALEALNDLGSSGEDVVIILNDNQMSINQNVGGISKHLEHLRLNSGYIRFKRGLERALRKTPVIGKALIRLMSKVKQLDRYWIRRKGIFFESLGYRYYGPVDGQDFASIEYHLKALKKIKGPVILHILTKKGQGYKYAEEDPTHYHGVAPFIIDRGLTEKQGQILTFSEIFAKELLQLGKENLNLVAISAAMLEGTGQMPFAKAFPERSFDVGIAEQHAITMGAGMCQEGLPVICSLYSTFLQRAMDQLVHDVCLQNIPLILTLDRAGLVGGDGETHQGLYDLAWLLPLPQIEILAPATALDLNRCLRYAVTAKHPVSIRYPRNRVPAEALENLVERANFTAEKKMARRIAKPASFAPTVRKISEGSEVVILVLGALLEEAYQASKLLKKQKINATVFSIIAAKPFDFSAIRDEIKQIKKLIVVEEGIVKGGFGESILPELIKFCPDLKFRLCGVEDPVQMQANRQELLALSKLDAEGIKTETLKLFLEQQTNYSALRKYS